MEILVTYKKRIIVEAITISSLNKCGYTLGSHKPLSHIRTPIPQHIMVETLVIVGNQSHQVHCLHPHTNGQTEVINWMIMHILRMYNSKHPCTWDEIIPYVHHNYNRSIHSSIDHNPFQVGLGFQPLGPMDVALPFAAT
jgi:hypothetical protein